MIMHQINFLIIAVARGHWEFCDSFRETEFRGNLYFLVAGERSSTSEILSSILFSDRSVILLTFDPENYSNYFV